MKDVIILTGVCLRKREEKRGEVRRLHLETNLLSKAANALRGKAMVTAILSGAASFLGILFGLELFGSIMAIVSLMALWMSEEGGQA